MTERNAVLATFKATLTNMAIIGEQALGLHVNEIGRLP
jgi:hypothetical protein